MSRCPSRRRRWRWRWPGCQTEEPALVGHQAAAEALINRAAAVLQGHRRHRPAVVVQPGEQRINAGDVMRTAAREATVVLNQVVVSGDYCARKIRSTAWRGIARDDRVVDGCGAASDLDATTGASAAHLIANAGVVAADGTAIDIHRALGEDRTTVLP